MMVQNPAINNVKIVICCAIGGVSMLAVSIVASIILKHKGRFSGPHNKLIALLCIFTACSCYHLIIFLIGTPEMTCYFGSAQLLYYTMLPMDPKYKLIDAVKTLDFANSYSYDLYQFLA
jgi:hypothetical protein